MSARPIPVTTDELAAALHKTPAAVRKLVARGVLKPMGVADRQGSGGRPQHLFDLRSAIAAVEDTKREENA